MYPDIITSRFETGWKKRGKDMKKERLFWGIFFIIGAVLLVISRLGILNTRISIWMLLLSVIFAATLIKSAIHRSIPGVLFSLAFLCIIYAEPLGITALTPWTVLGAALLGSIGAALLYRPERSWHQHSTHFDDSFSEVETIEGDAMRMESSFGSSIKYINSEDFRGAGIHCSFGAMKVYFDHAQVPQGQAAVKLDVSFGGVELYIPRSWQVVNQLSAAFGGVDEKGRCQPDGTVSLVLNGKVSFSGVTIIYI